MVKDEQVEEVLTSIRGQLPKEIQQLPFEVGETSHGKEGIWVWVVMPGDAPEEVWKWESRQNIRDRVRDAFERAGIEPWVFIRFSDQAPFDGVR